MKILLVDDTPTQLDTIRRFLVLTEGFQVATACDSDDAMAKAAAGRDWNAFVTDVMLLEPRGKAGTGSGDGLVLAVKLRRKPNYANVAIVVYSVTWLHDDFTRLKEEYEPSGIFLCDGASGPAICGKVKAAIGKGPWVRKVASQGKKRKKSK